MKQRVVSVHLRGLTVIEYEDDILDERPIVECDCGRCLFLSDVRDGGMASLEELGWGPDGFCPGCRPKLQKDPEFCPF